MELLATFVVMTIVMTIVYNVLANGIGVAKKIGIEGQLRDDADYVVTMIMNELNSGEFDQIRGCSDNSNCIELVDNESLGFTSYQKGSETVYDVEEQPKTETITRIELTQDAGGKQKFQINQNTIDGQGDFTGSTLSSTCSACSNGVIDLKLVINDKALNEPLQLESKFGF
jgi:hypothetical protein